MRADIVSGKSKKVVKITAREAKLRRKLRQHLQTLGFRKSKEGALEFEDNGKETIRALHSLQRKERLNANTNFIAQRAPKLLRFFASGSEINPSRIMPVLERIVGCTWQSELFKLASLTWSIPVSNGFGRRLRYLVWDGYNDKLIGLIAIGDPVFNLSVRDNFIGWSIDDRRARLVNMMDAYVLGALPPYNLLLGGKMVACLVRSHDVYDDFYNKYGGTIGIISRQKKNAHLLAVTTSSSMGRSSVYNRLKLGEVIYFDSIGYTGGWGHFHIPDKLFLELREYLRSIGHSYADLHKFGKGPNWRLRTTRAALVELGFREDLLRHGVQREVFISHLASNGINILRTGEGQPNLSSLLSANEIGKLAVDRWILPRSERHPEFRRWSSENLIQLLDKTHCTMQNRMREVI